MSQQKPESPPGTYQYIYGDLPRYNSIIEKIRTLDPDLTHRKDVPSPFTVEIPSATKIQDAIEVSMTWIRELCKLAGEESKK